MSRAFVKEDGPDTTRLPDLPISSDPNFVTPRGLAELQARLAGLQAELAVLRARSERLDLMPERAVERDIRYVEARLRSAIEVDPAGQPTAEVAFGARILVRDAAGRETSYQIVGEDEARGGEGRITAQSPLARALLGARSGDWVDWRKPMGIEELEVLKISYGEGSP